MILDDIFAGASGSAIVARVNHMEPSIKSHPLFSKLSSGRLSQDSWQKWGVQYYHAVKGFESVMERLAQRARQGDMDAIARQFDQILADEKGMNLKTNIPTLQGSHEDWRRDFYQALGLDYIDMQSAELIQGTRDYKEKFRSIVECPDVFFDVGVLLNLEHMVTTEMEFILEGLKKTEGIKDRFNYSDGADPRLITSNLRYVWHHTNSNVAQHLLYLIDAVMKDIGEEQEKLSQVLRGIDFMHSTRMAFYDSLSIHLKLDR